MIYLWAIVIAFGILAARLWVEDYRETHGRRARHQAWGRAPRPAMAVGRHR